MLEKPPRLRRSRFSMPEAEKRLCAESGEVRILRGVLKGVHLSRIAGSQIHPCPKCHEIKGLLWK
jgi:hypothetical protein